MDVESNVDIARCCFSYEVMVIASDDGDPPKSGSMIVSIKVVDVNDNFPVFDNSTYEVGHHYWWLGSVVVRALDL